VACQILPDLHRASSRARRDELTIERKRDHVDRISDLAQAPGLLRASRPAAPMTMSRSGLYRAARGPTLRAARVTALGFA